MSDSGPSRSNISHTQPKSRPSATRPTREFRVSGRPFRLVQSFGHGQIDVDRLASIVRKILDGAEQ